MCIITIIVIIIIISISIINHQITVIILKHIHFTPIVDNSDLSCFLLIDQWLFNIITVKQFDCTLLFVGILK